MKPLCPRCGAGCSVKHGRFYRDDDAQSIQRYRCRTCSKCHSSATHTPTYSKRPDRSGAMRERTLEAAEPHVSTSATITTDEHARYAAEIKKVFPTLNHVQHPSVRGSLTGQGEELTYSMM